MDRYTVCSTKLSLTILKNWQSPTAILLHLPGLTSILILPIPFQHVSFSRANFFFFWLMPSVIITHPPCWVALHEAIAGSLATWTSQFPMKNRRTPLWLYSDTWLIWISCWDGNLRWKDSQVFSVWAGVGRGWGSVCVCVCVCVYM